MKKYFSIGIGVIVFVAVALTVLSLLLSDNTYDSRRVTREHLSNVVRELETYRLNHGEYPDWTRNTKNGFMAPSPTHNDFWGNPFFFMDEKNSRKLYSLGPNGEYDNGRVDDIVISFDK